MLQGTGFDQSKRVGCGKKRKGACGNRGLKEKTTTSHGSCCI